MIPAAARARSAAPGTAVPCCTSARTARPRAARARTALLAVALTASLGACASGAARPTLPGDAQNAAPASVAPEGLTEVRESLAAMRAENREAMDATLIQSRPLSQTSDGGFFGRMLGFLGRGISDAITLSALGL